MFLIKEGLDDDKLYKGPVTGPEIDGDDPAAAEEFAAKNKLGDNDTILTLFTPEEKLKLQKMIKHGEFNKTEAAVLNALMAEVLNLDQLGAWLGVASPRTKGAPMSRPATLKELNRILTVIAKRSKLKLGKEVDLSKIADMRRELKAANAEKRREAKEKARERKRLEKEFWQAQNELNRVRRAHGLKPEYYNRAYTGQFMGN